MLMLGKGQDPREKLEYLANMLLLPSYPHDEDGGEPGPLGVGLEVEELLAVGEVLEERGDKVWGGLLVVGRPR